MKLKEVAKDAMKKVRTIFGREKKAIPDMPDMGLRRNQRQTMRSYCMTCTI